MAVIIALLAGGCGSGGTTVNGVPALPVELVEVERGNITQTVRVTGTVVAGTTVHVAAVVPGRLEEVLVKVGDRVSRGQVLARLESAQQQAALIQAQAGLEQARAKADLDEQNLEKIRTLYDQGVIARQELDIAVTTAVASRAAVAAAEAAVSQAVTALDNTYIRAPISGEVSARHLEPGAVAQGAIVTLVSSGDLQVEIGVTEQDINYLEQGREVTVYVPATTEKHLRGRVAGVSPAADERSRLYSVKVEIVNIPDDLKPGMAASVQFATRKTENAVVIPKAAVVSRAGQNLVFTVEDGRAKGRVVVPGIDDGSRVEILNGLVGGEMIMVKGQDFVSEGQQVEVVNGGRQS